jgi:heptosyltransferase-2
LLKAGIKYRVGGTKTGITYGKGFFLHKKAFPNNKWQHKIDDNLDIIRFINIHPTTRRLELSLNPQVEKNIKTLLSKKKKPLIGMNVASQHPSQRWHPERFAQVANELIKKYKATIVFTGIEKERDQIQAVINHIPNKQSILDLTGKTNFEELKAVIKHLDVLITIDSSSTHIASAFDTPVLTLFGSTIPTFWGPTGKHSSYIWKNKEANVGWRREYLIVGKDDSMEKISTQEVLEQAKKLLKN